MAREAHSHMLTQVGVPTQERLIGSRDSAAKKLRMRISVGSSGATALLVVGILALAPPASATNSVRHGPPGNGFYSGRLR